MNGRSKLHSTRTPRLGRYTKNSIEKVEELEFQRHDRRIAKYRDRWGKVFTLSVIKAPKIDFYGRGSKDDYQKNWDLGFVYQNELHASMKNASQSNLLRWMICGSTPSDISDACVGRSIRSCASRSS